MIFRPTPWCGTTSGAGALALAFGSYSFPSFAQSTAPSANPAYSASTAPAFSGPPVMLEKDESPAIQAEKLKTWQKAQREQSLRNFFPDNGFSDKTLQDAILSSAKEREVALRQARVTVLESKRQLYNALLVDKAAPEQIGKITEQYQEAIEAYRKQGLALDGALDVKVGFGKQLKLKELLLMLGLIGEPAPFPFRGASQELSLGHQPGKRLPPLGKKRLCCPDPKERIPMVTEMANNRRLGNTPSERSRPYPGT